jgi:hypothetical protein
MPMVLKGVEQVQAAFKSAQRRWPEGIGTALYKAGVQFIADAVRRAPIEHGTLRRSAYVSAPAPKDRPRVELGFGVVYAYRQHEGDYEHKDGERHYLKNAIESQIGNVTQRIPEWTKTAAEGSKDTSSAYPRAPNIAPQPAQVRRADVRAKFRRGSANVKAKTGR